VAGGTPETLLTAGLPSPTGSGSFAVFVGPKDYHDLKALGHDLQKVIDFSRFSIIYAVTLWLFLALTWINSYVGNYGWSIIILTVLINAAIFPLRHKSVVSMRRMQELQPEIKAIQERYGKLKATDPERQKMNSEMMALYKAKGVNPAGGCVPMLLTIPVLFAFYALLSQAIEIRGAPFALWIQDLSVRDMLYVTPILMGVSMVWQQKITPSSADPMQQKMMMLMPIVFTFMFLWAPSGLVLYWFVGNVLAIAQQYITNQIVGPPKPALARPPAERRLKKVGSGRA
jgi:YidC/Oxa1 family membrane protein insertase